MYVTGLGRSGNTIEKGNKNVLRLSGEIIVIPKPYDREKAKKVIESIAKICVEISSYYKLHNKIFAKTK
jgi:ACT domain-containing protein